MPDIINPKTNPENLGDLADPWEMFLEGEIGFDDLPAESQAYARKNFPQLVG
jgi:hypothetical protein